MNILNDRIWTPPQMQALRFYGDWYDFWMIAPVQWILPKVRFRWLADIDEGLLNTESGRS